jgi:hypothetical protein
MKGKSVLVPPAVGTFGTAGRNVFRDSGYKNWDLSQLNQGLGFGGGAAGGGGGVCDGVEAGSVLSSLIETRKRL